MLKAEYLFFLIITLQHISLCICGFWQNPSIARIIHGNRADLKDFSHVTAFFNDRSLCGANIITSRTMITAAHCFDSNTDVTLMICGIGNTGDKVLNGTVKTIAIWDYVVNSEYDDLSFKNDIAALFTEESTPLSITVQRAMIVDTDEFLNEKRTIFTATGWGMTTYPNGSISSQGLQYASLHQVDRQKCMKINGMTFGDDVFCLNGDDGADTCTGDSGSAVLWKGMIVGLVSCGDGCGLPGTAGLYCNVFTMMNWLEDEIDKFHVRLCDFKEKKERGEISHVD